MAAMYFATVQSAAMPRSALCQVCTWALMKPGSTMQSAASMTSAPSDAEMLRRNRRDAVVFDEHVADRKVRDARIHRDDGAALDENSAHALPPPMPRRLVSLVACRIVRHPRF